MKINYGKDKDFENFTINSIQDVSALLDKFKDEYGDAFVYQVEGELFFFRPLGRKEYNKLCATQEITEYDKENAVCQLCTLWPKDYDFDECEAGIPTKLSTVILKASYLDSIETRTAVTSHFREEMFELDNQVSCIIHEAFPDEKIEDIENWGIEKTAKFLSRAEWILVNLRGAQIAFDPMGQEAAAPQQGDREETNNQAQEPIEFKNGETIEARQERLNLMGGKKEKMTPDKLAELRRRFPEIDWTNDSVLQEGEKALEQYIDNVAPALRTGGPR